MQDRYASTTKSQITTRALLGIAFAFVVASSSGSAYAQAGADCGNGYQVVARHWDAVLRRNWEMRQDCAHPDWPARAIAVGSISNSPAVIPSHVVPSAPTPTALPILVHAGEQVRLWMQDSTVHIEMSGVAEQSARSGQHLTVRITQQTDDAGLTVQRIGGVVRGAGSVEMER